jgi:hypothetical protein
MFDRLGQSPPAQGADVIARAMGALALIALAVVARPGPAASRAAQPRPVAPRAPEYIRPG